jgi:hypothetical protein
MRPFLNDGSSPKLVLGLDHTANIGEIEWFRREQRRV